jgi:hypothetical protein
MNNIENQFIFSLINDVFPQTYKVKDIIEIIKRYYTKLVVLGNIIIDIGSCTSSSQVALTCSKWFKWNDYPLKLWEERMAMVKIVPRGERTRVFMLCATQNMEDSLQRTAALVDFAIAMYRWHGNAASAYLMAPQEPKFL